MGERMRHKSPSGLPRTCHVDSVATYVGKDRMGSGGHHPVARQYLHRRHASATPNTIECVKNNRTELFTFQMDYNAQHSYKWLMYVPLERVDKLCLAQNAPPRLRLYHSECTASTPY